jgi:hypothetical protein
MMKTLATFAKWALVGFVALCCPPLALVAADVILDDDDEV